MIYLESSCHIQIKIFICRKNKNDNLKKDKQRLSRKSSMEERNKKRVSRTNVPGGGYRDTRTLTKDPVNPWPLNKPLPLTKPLSKSNSGSLNGLKNIGKSSGDKRKTTKVPSKLSQNRKIKSNENLNILGESKLAQNRKIKSNENLDIIGDSRRIKKQKSISASQENLDILGDTRGRLKKQKSISTSQDNLDILGESSGRIKRQKSISTSQDSLLSGTMSHRYLLLTI